jgi:uncharacterized protein (DUF58 family)
MRISNKFRQRIFRGKPEDTLPKKIHHKRIYILPTKRGWVFLASLLLMLVVSINYALSLGYALCFLLTGLFAATLIETYKNLAGIGIDSIQSKNVFAGDKAEFNIEMTSGVSSRHDIEVFTADATGVCSIDANAKSYCHLVVDAQKRGSLALGRLTLKSRYPLGLWYTWCYLHTPAAAIVYPKPESNPPPLPSSATDNDGDKNTQERSGDVAGLRNYQEGDSPSHIAWKSVARGQGLLVKMFEDNQLGGEVMLSQQATNHIEVESQLARLCAWVLEAENTQTHYAMSLSDSQLELNIGEVHKKRALESLALHGLAT